LSSTVYLVLLDIKILPFTVTDFYYLICLL
jgi:hypothetical protein